MNNHFPELISELNRQRIIREIDAIHFGEKFVEERIPNHWVERSLFALGDWMVARGESLRRRHNSISNVSTSYIVHKIGM